MEYLAYAGTLLFGLAFFTFTVHQVTRDESARHQRLANERREFGAPKYQKRRFLRNSDR